MRQPPPNPAAAQARAAMREYSGAGNDNEKYIAAVFERWPDMLRYASTAHVSILYDAQREQWRRCVTVTIWPPDAAARRE
jgi:hypothetical protein